MTWRALPLVVLTLVVAAPARAGTVSVAGTTLTFAAGAGEANAVGLSHQSGFFFIRDTDVPLSAGPGCMQSAPDEARCADHGITAAALDLGDGDDSAGVSSFEIAALDLSIHGGPGNDTLTSFGHLFGDDGADRLSADDEVGAILDGGPGNDRLQDGDKPDQLFGGDGDDELTGGDGDVVAGGRGYDEIETYAANVTIDCQGHDDDAVQPDRRPILRNCLPAPAVKVRVTRVSIKRFVRTGVPIDVSCDHACAVALFLRPGTCPYHGTGTTLAHRSVPRTRSGFVKAQGPTAHWLGTAGGPASHKAISRAQRCKASLEVVAFSRDGLSTTRKIPVRIG